MKRHPLPIIATLCLPLFVTGCPDDSTGDEEVGATDTSTDDATTTDATTDDATTTANDTSTTDDTTTEESTTEESTTDTTDTTDSTTDTGTDTGTETATETGTETGGVCGDMVIDVGEECEGVDLGGADCISLGYSGGELLCGADCLFDASGCFNQECGNGVVEGNEECDVDDLAGLTCVDLGFASGSLACAGDCTYDTAACSDCGNDLIDGNEACDGGDLGGQTCAGLGYLGGTLSCSDTCDAVIEDACVNSWWGEDFEGGAVLPPEWVLSGNGNWFGSATMPHAGAFSGESGNIGDSQQEHMDVTLNFVANGTVQFWRRTDTETNFDYLRFYIDGVQQVQWSGVNPWAQSVAYNVAAGNHTLRWTYYKDISVSTVADAVWVDDIVTTNALLP